MADEESFVILGTSPSGASLSLDLSRRKSSGILESDSPGLQLSTMTECNSLFAMDESIQAVKPMIRNEPKEELLPSKENSLNASIITNGVEKMANASGPASVSGSFKSQVGNNTNGDGKSPGPASLNRSLAASYILGEVDAEVIKTSIVSQFGSLGSLELNAEDLEQIRNYMEEYKELKKTLANLNLTMQKCYDKFIQDNEESQRRDEEYKRHLTTCQEEIAALRNGNLILKHDIETHIQSIKIHEDVRKQEQLEFRKDLSEKQAQIQNLRAYIEKMEAEQLKSFEYISKHANDTKEKHDYIEREEHERMVKDYQRQMSAIVAENLEIKDMKQQYIDEINCLKVNLTSAEELLKTARADIDLLKSKDKEHTIQFCQLQRMRDELAVLKQQVEIYRNDFAMERTARENLAGEKEKLLQDLRLLQKRNQELLEQAQKRIEDYESQGHNGGAAAGTSTHASSSTHRSAQTQVGYVAELSSCAFNSNLAQRPIRALPTPVAGGAAYPSEYSCPVCHNIFNSIIAVQNHIEGCLEQT